MFKLVSVLQRIKEPSTWAGLAVLLAVLGVPALHVELLGQAVNGLAALAGAVAVFLPESKPAEVTSKPENTAAGAISRGG